MSIDYQELTGKLIIENSDLKTAVNQLISEIEENLL